MFDLAISIVSYNARDLLEDTLRTVFESEVHGTYRVVVVDNASVDGSVAMVRRLFPEVIVIESKENKGFSWATNKGIRACEARCYLLLNSDVLLPVDASQRIWDSLMNTSDAGMVVPQLIYPDGTLQNTARMFPSPIHSIFGRKSFLTRIMPNSRFVKRYMPVPPSDGRMYDVDWISVAVCMVKHEVIEDVGLLDEEYFMYWTDADWCFRAKRHGWKVYCAPSVSVVHREGGSSKGTSATLVVAFHKGVLRFYRKHYLRSRWHPMYPVALIGLSVRACLIMVGNLFRSWIWQRPEAAENKGEERHD